ncbi:MAG: hypothetical protein WAO91_07880 [Candidatus Nitrosotenuis sp.]
MRLAGEWLSVFGIGILLIGSGSAFATHITTPITVTIDQNPALIENSLVLTVRDFTRANNGITETASVTFTPASGTEKTISMTEFEDTGTFVLKYIKFTQGTAGTNDIPAVPDQTFTVRATITSGGTTSDPSSPIPITVKSSISQTWTKKSANSETPLNPTPPTPSGTCDTSGNDDDGICDNWEDSVHGLIVDWPSTSDPYTYPCDPVCPNRDVNDIYVEFDYMDDHDPDLDAIKQVKAAFAKMNINLHVQIDEVALVHAPTTKFPGSNTRITNYGFDQVKALWNGTKLERDSNNDGVIDDAWKTAKWKSKKQAFHYALLVHAYAGDPSSTGIAEIWGNDFMMAAGPLTGGIGSTDEQAGTFMHEIGHNLKLDHGGPWNLADAAVNCKPNYLSVMSYSRQTSNLVTDRDLNYSSNAIVNVWGPPSQLAESSGLNEDGVSNYENNDERMVYGLSNGGYLYGNTGGADVDWDGVGGMSGGMASNAYANVLPGCPSATGLESLTGHDDWNALDLKFTESGENYAEGAPVPTSTGSEFKARTFAGAEDLSYSVDPPPFYATEEITKEIIIEQRLLRITSLELFLNLYDDSSIQTIVLRQAFTDPNESKDTRQDKGDKDASYEKSKMEMTDEDLYLSDDPKEVAKIKKEILAKTTKIKELVSKSYNKKKLTGDVGLQSAIEEINALQKYLKSKMQPQAYKTFLEDSEDTITAYSIALETQLPNIHSKDKIRHLPPPVKQMREGVEASDVKCRQELGLELFLKSSDGSAICVKTKSGERLAKLGLATPTLGSVLQTE